MIRGDTCPCGTQWALTRCHVTAVSATPASWIYRNASRRWISRRVKTWKREDAQFIRFSARILRDDFHWFAKNAVPEAQAPIAARAGGSREGPELVSNKSDFQHKHFDFFLFLWWWWSSSFSPVYCLYTVTLREICPCGKSHQRRQAQKDLQMANGEGSGQSEAEC